MITDARKNDWYEIERMASANNRSLHRAKFIFIAIAVMIYLFILINQLP